MLSKIFGMSVYLSVTFLNLFPYNCCYEKYALDEDKVKLLIFYHENKLKILLGKAM